MAGTPRKIAGTYLQPELVTSWVRQKRVVTVTVNVRTCMQTGVIDAVRKASIDGTIIAPDNLPKGYDRRYDYIKIGQIFMPEGSGFEREKVNVIVSPTNPAVVLLENKKYLAHNLYGRDEQGNQASEEVVLKRIAFFNRAVATLIRAADINPSILHVVDWPTALSLLYLEEQNVPIPNILFTYPDARFQGLFSKSLLPILGLTGQRPIDATYHDKISLAQVGMIRAGRIAVWTERHVDEVTTGVKPVGSFRTMFEARLKNSELSFLFTTDVYADRVSNIDMYAPRQEDKDYIRALGFSYRHFYELLDPQPAFARIKESMLYDAAEQIDLTPYSRYSRSLKEMAVDPDLRGAIPAFKALVKEFGSKAALEAIRLPEAKKREFVRSLKELSVNWLQFANIVRNALFGVPKTFETMETIGTLPLLSAPEEVMKAGLAALRGNEANPFADLMLVTMSGGLGQRLAFNIMSSADLMLSEASLPTKINELLKWCEKTRKLNYHFTKEDAAGWHIPKSEIAKFTELFEDKENANELARFQEEIPRLIELLSSIKNAPRLVKIPAQLLTEEDNSILQREAIEQAIDQKNDKVWLIPVDRFFQLRPELSAKADTFSRRLLEEVQNSEPLQAVNVPKGAFKLPGLKQSLFEMQARSIAALSEIIGKKILWGVMLSSDNQELVERYFETNLVGDCYFGVLDKSQVKFKSQKNKPLVKATDAKKQKADIVVDEKTGRIISEAGGHGGFHDVTDRLLTEIKAEHNFEPAYVMGGNIENVWFNLQLRNPGFITRWLGQHLLGSFDVTGLTTEKTKPTEKMGIFARADNKPQVIEYSHPNFTAAQAYAHTSARGRIYFVKEKQGNNVLVIPAERLLAVFDILTPPDKRNVTEEMKSIKAEYTLIGSGELPKDAKLLDVNEQLQPVSEIPSLAALGEVNLEFRQGNANIFLFRSSIIRLVTNNPSIMAKAEHKQGFHRRGVKIEDSIFDLLALLRDLEALPGVQQLNVGFVEEARSAIFGPIKDPSDVITILKELPEFLKRFPIK